MWRTKHSGKGLAIAAAVSVQIDGHDLPAIVAAFDRLEGAPPDKPHVIIADTVKGKGVARMEGDVNWHVGNLNPQDYADVEAELRERAHR